MRYRGVIHGKPGVLFGGISRKVVSSWFDTRQEAVDWVAAMSDGHEHRIERWQIQEREDARN